MPAATPWNAGVVTKQGLYYFVAPTSLAVSYTGCQVMWDERGRVQTVLRFANGELKEYSSAEGSVLCQYERGALANKSPEACPSPQAAIDAMLTFPFDLEPRVPPDRDPRFKGR